MNLQPIFPAKPHQRLAKACRGCGSDVLTGNGFADLDGKAGDYHCIRCVKLTLRHSEIHDALVNRDRRELQQAS